MSYLIVGIDPGITSAFCAIDLNGNLVRAFSSKKLGLERLISEIRKVGIPVVISCDVKVAPAIVEKISAIFHAKLISPPEDLKAGEKQLLYSKFEQLEDMHQKDACAAAVFAFNRYKLLFQKINEVLRTANKTEKAEEVKMKLIMHKAKSIKDALLEKPLPIMLQQKKRVKSLIPKSTERIISDELKSARQKIEELKAENKKLMDRLEWLELVTKPKADVSKIAELRKITIENLEENVKKLGVKIGEFNERIIHIKKMFRFYKERGIVFVSEINDLSSTEIDGLDELDFGNCLLVNNLTAPGKDSLEKLKELQINHIFYKNNKTNLAELKKLKFKVFPATEIEIKEENKIRYIPKEALDKLLAKMVKIEEIITEHRQREL